MAKLITLTELKDGTATIDDLFKLNALLDMQQDLEAASMENDK
jgi:hypothetical protein